MIIHIIINIILTLSPDNIDYIWGNKSPEALKIQIDEHKTIKNLGQRFSKNTEWFLGTRYEGGTNTGTPPTFNHDGTQATPAIPETLNINFKGMDCVTFIEYALAMTLSPTWGISYEKTLARIRYSNNNISYKSRNHYMSQWVISNQKSGFFRDITPQIMQDTPYIEVSLCILPAFPKTTVSLRIIPIEESEQIQNHLEDGDILLFTRNTPCLDYNHVGVVIKNGNKMILRHARQNRTVQNDTTISAYMHRARFTGLTAIRLIEPS